MPRLGHRWTSKPPLGTPIDRTHLLARAAIGEWSFDEGGGKVARNVIRPGLADATFAAATAAPTWKPGGSGHALDFARASGQYALCDGAIFGGGSYTMTARIRMRSPQANSGDPDYSTADILNVTNSSYIDLHALAVSGNPGVANAQVNWVGAIGLGQRVNISGLAVPVNVWHDLAATYDRASGVLRLYQDGEQTASGVVNAGTDAVATTIGAIGKFRSTVLGGYFDGRIEFIRFRSVSYSADEIAWWHAEPYAHYLAPATRRFFAPVGVGLQPIVLTVGVAGGDAAGIIPIVLKGPRTLTVPAGVGDGSAIVPARIVGPLIRAPAPAGADGTSALPAVIRSPLTRAVPVASVDALDLAPARIISKITCVTPVTLSDISSVTPAIVRAAVTIPVQPGSANISGVIPSVSPSALIIVPSVTTVNVSAAVPAVLHVTLTLATPPATSTAVASAPVPAGTTLLTVAPSVTDAATVAPVSVPGPVILAAPVATVPIVAIAPALVPGPATPAVSVIRTDAIATGPASSPSLLSLPGGRAGADAIVVAPDVPGGPVTRIPGVAAGTANAESPAIVLPAVNLIVTTSISNVNSYSVNITLPSIVLSTSSSVINSLPIPVLPIPSPVSLAVPSAYATMITADTALVLPFLIIPTTVTDASALALSPDSAQGVPPLVPGTAGIDGIAISPDLIPSGTALIGVPVAEADVTATGAGISAEPAESLTEAIIQAFHASPLALEFGEVNPEWRPKIRVRKAFAGDEPPYVVLAGGEDARARGESPDADGNSYPIEESTFQATIYAPSDADARDLGEAFSDYMIGQSEKGALRFAGGTVMLFGRINPYQAPFRDPEEGPGGGYVYGQVLRFRVIIGA
jgi:hypothetical protein